jgi:hypothetical protein
MFIDPDGKEIRLGNLYEKVDGKFKYQAHIKSFEMWATTKEGQSWLAERAQAGLTIIGSEGQIIFRATKEGELSKKGIDAKFLAGGPAHGYTEYNISENGNRVEITYSVTTDVKDLSPQSILQTTEVWLHEALFHGDIAERDFITKKQAAGGSLNPKTDLYTGWHTRSQDRETSRYWREAPSIMMQTSKRLGLNYDFNTVWDKYMKKGFSLDTW